MSCGKVEISDDCTSYTDISGETQSIGGTEQTRMSGEAYTQAGGTAIVKGGKREPMEITVNIVYTETDAEVYEVARDIFESTTECGAPVCVRWSPGGGDAGDEQVTTAEGILVSFTYPPLDASAAGPIMGAFTIKTPSVSTTIVAS
jgi:hypothetical protein